jgi:hypothetical protein
MYRPSYKQLHYEAKEALRKQIEYTSEVRNELLLAKALRCSFCDKNQYEVERLIAGPSKVHICNECVTLCVEIIEEKEYVMSAVDYWRKQMLDKAKKDHDIPEILRILSKSSWGSETRPLNMGGTLDDITDCSTASATNSTRMARRENVTTDRPSPVGDQGIWRPRCVYHRVHS